AHVTTRGTEENSNEKRLEDVQIVWDFPEVFLKTFRAFPLTRQMELQIDLIPGVAPVTRTPYRLALSVRDERVVEATARTIRQRLYKAKFLTLGSSDLVYQEEGWINSNVH
ncbi:hypothetical protein Tco_0868123, partial [Tanacetum coccineum]